MKKENNFIRGRRGAVVAPLSGKARITIRLDEEILAWFREEVNKSGGGNYQTLINDALREHITKKQEPLEKVIRRILREELKRIA